MPKLKSLIARVLDVQQLEVWHPESPGMKNVVRRSRFGRLVKPKYFATLGESIKCDKIKA